MEKGKSMTKPLTPKQEAFIAEYLIDLNATAAYKRAGYVAKGNAAEVNAARLLRNAQVSAAVQAAMDKRADDLEISAKYVLDSIKRVAEAAESEGKFSDALRGYELLGKHRKLFTDKTEVTGKDGKDLNMSPGGVLVVPGAMNEKDWEKMMAKQGGSV